MAPVFPLQNKKIWVAGHNGLVGGAVVRYLREHCKSCKIITISHKELDLTDQTATHQWLATNKPDVVILAAAYVGGIGANAAEPADFIYKNLAIQNNVIHGAYLAGVEKLLFLGSSCIYPKLAAQPITEEALLTGALEPTNEAYAIAKIAGIKMCDAYRAQYGCDFISAMPCNLYGFGDYYDENRAHVIPALLMKIHAATLENAPSVTLWGTGTPLREFLYVDDLAAGLIYLLENFSSTGPINIGSGTEITIRDLAHKIAQIVGYEGAIVFDASKPDGAPRKLIDSSQINKMGWAAKTGLEEGLKQAYHDYLNHSEQSKNNALTHTA